MKCSNCGKENDESSKFCTGCGNKLEKKIEVIFCPNCGKDNPIDSNFCNGCGTKLESEPEIVTCPQCGIEITDDSAFCSECGTPISVKPKEKTWGRDFKDDVVSDYNESRLGGKFLNRYVDNKVSNKFYDSLVSVADSAGIVKPRTTGITNKLLPKEYQDAFNTLSDNEKGVWNVKIGVDDLIWAIRKMDRDDQLRYLPIFLEEVRSIANAPDFGYVVFYRANQAGMVKSGVSGLTNVWARQRELEKEIEEYYNNK